MKLTRALASILVITALLISGTLCLSPGRAVAAGESITFTANLGGAMRSCIIEGTTVYALQEPKLHIIDISSPSNPVTLSTLTLPGIGRRLTKQDDKLYIACWSGGLVIVDISDPTAPQQLSQTIFDTSAEQKNCETQDVGVSGIYAYVIDQIAGLITLDISNPAAPEGLESLKISPRLIITAMISISLTSTCFWPASLTACIPLTSLIRQAPAFCLTTPKTPLILLNRKIFTKLF